jgi:hypothetical protein
MPEAPTTFANPAPGTIINPGALVTPGGAAGNPGAQGVAGAAGAAGPPGTGLNAFNTTTAAFTVPAVGATVNVILNDASWVVTGQFVFVDSAGGPGTAGALQVSAKSGNQVTLLNPAPAPAIPAASTSAAGLMNILSGVTTDYVGGDNACHPVVQVNGFLSKTAASTLTLGDRNKYIICSGGSWMLTLPAPAVGLTYNLRNDQGISGTTGTITVQPSSGTIDGAASLALLAGQECTLVTDGTNWRTLGRQRVVVIGTLDTVAATASVTVILPSGYRLFELSFMGFSSNAAASAVDYLVGQLSSNGGTSWNTTAYYQGSFYASSATAAGFNDVENGSNFLIIPNVVGTYPYGGARMVLYPGSANTYPEILLAGTGRNLGSYQSKMDSGGFLNTFGPMNALKYFCGNGNNITSCFLTVKGIV